MQAHRYHPFCAFLAFWAVFALLQFSVLATTYNTPTIDGVITTDWDADENMGGAVGQPTWILHVTWDENYIYIGVDGPDWTPSNNDAVWMFIDSKAGGTNLSVNGETIGVTADYALLFRQNSGASGYYVYDGGWPGALTNFAVSDWAWTSSGQNERTEVRVSWSTATNGTSTTPVPFNLVGYVQKNNGTYIAAWPSANTNFASGQFTFAFENTGGAGVAPQTATVSENPPDQPLPVNLTTFFARSRIGYVDLRWSTSSENENLGFEIYRKSEEKPWFQRISSYEDNPDLTGQGNANVDINYVFKDRDVSIGQMYEYRLADVDFNGNRTFHATIQIRFEDVYVAPGDFMLFQNYPNPFNPGTTIDFRLPQASRARLSVYNIAGQEVRCLVMGPMREGNHSVDWDGRDEQGNLLPSGIYFYELTTPQFNYMRKMILVK
ncbi:MAG TPA: FlgD immunoglobulin-like domain containing protein [Calditrichia bacterium]|nr:T9SS type A sorting domain-containing protein [Calditrichota bacterium]HQU71367.1 FlgD immunoglobulin-like domain containing protein [Calditrichia bacterium]HQV32491.1 FlgD immunoglobulin-like domain containing protein [Calditrichia bacterium]